MSDHPAGPEFDQEFWATVHQRVKRVRGLTQQELGRAENVLLAVEEEAQVVPVFPAPFWARVNKRAAKVREMALDELSDAEERLLNAPAANPGKSRAGLPGLLGRMQRPRHGGLPLRARVNTLGFVTAVLAVLMLLPQVAPISSFAGVRNRSPLAMLFSSEDNQGADRSEKSNVSESGAERSRSGSVQTGESGGGTGGERSSGASSMALTKGGESGSGQNGKSGTASPSPGASGQGAAGSAGSTTPGSLDASSEDGASGASLVPAAPSNVLVTAVDATSIRLRWKDNSSDETGFEIERKGHTAVGRQATEANTKSFVWTGLMAGTEFCFRVRAQNGTASSDWSPEQYRCVTTHAAQSTPVALTPVSCSNEGSLSKGPGLQETEIVFRNQTSQIVKIYALGGGGVRETSATALAPQSSTTISSFVGNPYVVTTGDEASRCLAIFSGESWASVATISEPGV